MMAQRKTATVTNAARVEKLRAAWQMRIDGHTVEQIARHFRIAQSTASRWLSEAYGRRTAPVAAELKAIELDKLDQAERAVLAVLRRPHPTISGGKIIAIVDKDTGEDIPIPDDGPILQAVDRLLKIGQRRAALLGLDEPNRISVDAQSLGREIHDLIAVLGGDDDDDPGT